MHKILANAQIIATVNVVVVEIVGTAPDRTMPPSAQTDGKHSNGMLGGVEEAEAVEGQIRPWLLYARGEKMRRVRNS
jgi:hypothetical protein